MTEPEDVRETYHEVVAVKTGVSKGMNETTFEAFTSINMDMTVILEDGSQVVAHFLLPHAEAAEQVGASLMKAAADWRDEVRIARET